ncbi:Nn.00g020910.m01.CDS01 [Neocucurbitaria sp. VM-36]
MTILDLPPEILERIIAFYVTDIGICKAAKARLTCSTFASAIFTETLQKQPGCSFAQTQAKAFLQKNLAAFLASRTNAAYNVPTILPTIVSETVDTYETMTGIVGYDQHQAWIKEVSTVVAMYWKEALELLATDPSSGYIKRQGRQLIKDNIRDTAFLLAIGLERCDLVRGFLEQGVSPWTSTRSLAGPLHLAVTLHNKHILQLLLHSATTNDGGLPCKTRSKALLEAILQGLKLGRPRAALHLLTWHVAHIGVPSSAQYCDIFTSAADANVIEFVDLALQKSTGIEMKQDIIVRTIIRVLDLGMDSSATRLLQTQFRHVGVPSRANFRDMFRAAVKNDAAELVGAIIDQGCGSWLEKEYVRIVLSTFHWGKLMSKEVLQMCLSKRLLCVDTFYRYHTNAPAHLILYWAVSFNSVQLTSTILDQYQRKSLGGWAPEDAVFRKAIELNNPDMIQLLLDRGFDPEAGENAREKSTFELARHGSAASRLIFEAVSAKKEALGDDYWTPERYVWDPEVQQDRLVAYSFAPNELEETFTTRFSNEME